MINNPSNADAVTLVMLLALIALAASVASPAGMVTKKPLIYILRSVVTSTALVPMIVPYNLPPSVYL